MVNTGKEFWRWPESRWTNPHIDWRRGEWVTAGIDIGSVSSQAVIMVNGELFCFSNTRTGSSSPASAVNAFNMAVDGTGITIKDIHFTVGTGYGRINVPFGNRAITEIACHAKGANWMYGPDVRTVLDIGGQDCKVIKIDEKGKVKAFLMNDKCSAGTGLGMETFAELLGIPIQDVGEISFMVSEEPPPVSSNCVVFAKTEAINLLRGGWPKEKVLAAYWAAMAQKVFSLLDKIEVEKEFAITGGITKNQGVVKRISRLLDIEACETKWYKKEYREMGFPFDPQIAGAIGAALFGKFLAEKAAK